MIHSQQGKEERRKEKLRRVLGWNPPEKREDSAVRQQYLVCCPTADVKTLRSDSSTRNPTLARDVITTCVFIMHPLCHVSL